MPFGGSRPNPDFGQRAEHEVAPADVERGHLADAFLRPHERLDRGELDRLEQPGVDVRLELPVVRDRLGVADDRTAAPAGHVVALREREDLDADVERAGRREEAGRDVAVESQLGVRVVVHHENVVLARERDDLRRRTRRGRPRRSGCSDS